MDEIFNEFSMTSEGLVLTENQRKFARDIAISRVLSKYQKEYADYVLEEEQKILTHIQMIMENKNGRDQRIAPDKI